jgi:hypothetical protein
VAEALSSELGPVSVFYFKACRSYQGRSEETKKNPKVTDSADLLFQDKSKLKLLCKQAFRVPILFGCLLSARLGLRE